MDVAKLTEDAKVARLLAEATANVTADGGSCNLDATFYPLPKGQRAQAVVDAFRAAGLSASPTQWIVRGVMVQPPGNGRANQRYAANQALCESLKRSGWPVLPFYHLD